MQIMNPSRTTLDDLVEDFELFDTWEERYKYIIELGGELEALADEHRTSENLVQGCQSQVWLVVNEQPTDPPTYRFQADSDSQIVKGLVSMLISLTNGCTAEEIQSLDVAGLFERLGLSKHLSRSRSNGFHSMVKRMQTLTA